MKAVILCLIALVAIAFAATAPGGEFRTLDYKQIAKMRCSLNVNDETFYVFNGTVIAYETGATVSNKVLFKTVGINVGRCFQRNDSAIVLASRELLYYIDPVTDQIVDRWTNPAGETVTVMHVDNDPVLQVFPPGQTTGAMVFDGKIIMSLDIPLAYPNPLRNAANAGKFNDYSPQFTYQAGEFFKFISDEADLDNASLDTVGYSLVSWTRNGPWLPWMKRGNASGYLVYSSAGAKIDSWEHLPAQVKSELENRIPHYKHAPTCSPATTSVTSWSFFKTQFQNYLDGVKYPLSTPAEYGCLNNTNLPSAPTAAPSCSATATASIKNTWVANGETNYEVDISISNTGVQAISGIDVSISNAKINTKWNIQQVGSTNIHKVELWNNLAVGAKIEQTYGFIARSAGSPVVSVASVRC